MTISKIVIPTIDISSFHYSNDSLINGYHWLDYLTYEDKEYYRTHYSNDAYLKYQIKKLLRIKQIEDIIK